MPGVFSVTQWNVLADSLSQDFPKCNNEFLQWQYRSERLQLHLQHQANADIVCLEEVDHPELFKQILEKTHEILFHKKPDGEDGQLVAICKQKFQIVKSQPIQYESEKEKKQLNQSFWSIILKDKQTNKMIILLVTHLKAKKQFEEVRMVQVSQLLKHIQSLQQEESLKNVPIILAGDLNAEPTYTCIQKIKEWGFLRNVYEGQGINLTTYKIREPNDVQVRIIDYIFYSHEALDLISVKNIPDQKIIGPNGLPNAHFSSDHLSLTATFKIK